MTMRKSEKRGRPKTLNRQAIIKIAMDNYWQKGLTASLNSISIQAGVAKPSLYREFENEDGLTLAALDQYAELSFGQLKEILNGPRTFEEKIRSIAKHFCSDVSYKNGCLFLKMRSERIKVGPRTQARIKEIDSELLGVYRDFFRLGKENGEWSGGMSIIDAARYLTSQLELALTQRSRGVSPREVSKVLEVSLSFLIPDS
jgi:AcrR family transcriptional regulator